MAEPSIKLSLIAATVGRTCQLTRLLESLRAQTYTNFELIVVDQNPPEFLDEILAPFAGCFALLHLHSAVGLSHARNVGLGHVSGQAVAFPDDDCWYPPDVLERVASLLDANPSWDGITGRVVDPGSAKSYPWYDRESGPVDLRNLWRRSISFTIFLRRRVIQAVGLFDEQLGRGTSSGMVGAEESDFMIRALQQGFAVHYRADLRLYHPCSSSLYDSKRISVVFGEGRAYGHVLRRYHYTPAFVLYTWIRAMGGAARALLYGDGQRLRYYDAMLRGRMSGWFGGASHDAKVAVRLRPAPSSGKSPVLKPRKG